MKRLFLFFTGFMLAFSIGIAQAAEITLTWGSAENATGYKIYKSLDNGETWDAGTDIGNVTTYVYDAEETGLILFRISAYNNIGIETINTWAMAAYNHLWRPPAMARRLGIE